MTPYKQDLSISFSWGKREMWPFYKKGSWIIDVHCRSRMITTSSVSVLFTLDRIHLMKSFDIQLCPDFIYSAYFSLVHHWSLLLQHEIWLSLNNILKFVWNKLSRALGFMWEWRQKPHWEIQINWSGIWWICFGQFPRTIAVRN